MNKENNQDPEINDAPVKGKEDLPETSPEDQPEVNIKDKEDEEDENEKASAENKEDKLALEVAEAKDKYLRLYSEFENFRRRTARERIELTQTATENLMLELLPILDDFQRASVNEKADKDGLIEGYKLIDSKLSKTLQSQGLKKMTVKVGDTFDTEMHEAVSQIPAPKKKLKGKIVEVVEEGYYLGEKVIRFAKVVIGS